jgi:hypothetical protein
MHRRTPIAVIFAIIAGLLQNTLWADRDRLAQCQFLYQKLITSSSGIKSIDVPAVLRTEIRNEKSSHYTTAKTFAQHVGKSFAKLVFERIPKKGKTTIMIAMGGAEHLGTMLQIYNAQLRPPKDIEFKYVYLTSSMANTWYAYPRVQGSGQKSRVGIGPIPDSHRKNSFNDPDPDVLARYLSEFALFENDKLLVVDTGFQGSIPEAVGYVATEYFDYRGKVEGVMLTYANGMESVTPIQSLNSPGSPFLERETAFWSRCLDGNNSDGCDFANIKDAFPRSKQVRDIKFLANGNIRVSLSGRPTKAQIRDYQDTLLGLYDGLTAD